MYVLGQEQEPILGKMTLGGFKDTLPMVLGTINLSMEFPENGWWIRNRGSLYPVANEGI